MWAKNIKIIIFSKKPQNPVFSFWSFWSFRNFSIAKCDVWRVKSGLSCSVFFSLLNETLLKKIDRKMTEIEAKHRLADFFRKLKRALFLKISYLAEIFVVCPKNPATEVFQHGLSNGHG